MTTIHSKQDFPSSSPVIDNQPSSLPLAPLSEDSYSPPLIPATDLASGMVSLAAPLFNDGINWLVDRRIELELMVSTMLEAAQDAGDDPASLFFLNQAFLFSRSIHSDQSEPIANLIREKLIVAGDEEGLTLFEVQDLLGTGDLEGALDLLNHFTLEHPLLSPDSEIGATREIIRGYVAQIDRLKRGAHVLEILSKMGEPIGVQIFLARHALYPFATDLSLTPTELREFNASAKTDVTARQLLKRHYTSTSTKPFRAIEEYDQAIELFTTQAYLALLKEKIVAGEAASLEEAESLLRAQALKENPVLDAKALGLSQKDEKSNPLTLAHKNILGGNTHLRELIARVDSMPNLSQLLDWMEKLEKSADAQERIKTLFEFAKYLRQERLYIPARGILSQLAYQARHTPEGQEALKILHDSTEDNTIFWGLTDEQVDSITEGAIVEVPLVILSGGLAGLARASLKELMVELGTQTTGFLSRFLMHEGVQMLSGLFMESLVFTGIETGAHVKMGKERLEDLTGEEFFKRVVNGMGTFGVIQFSRHLAQGYGRDLLGSLRPTTRVQLPNHLTINPLTLKTVFDLNGLGKLTLKGMDLTLETLAFAAVPNLDHFLGNGLKMDEMNVGNQALISFLEILKLRLGGKIVNLKSIEERTQECNERIAELNGKIPNLDSLLKEMDEGLDLRWEAVSGKEEEVKAALARSMKNQSLKAYHLVRLWVLLKEVPREGSNEVDLKYYQYQMNALLKPTGYHLVRRGNHWRIEKNEKSPSAPFLRPSLAGVGFGGVAILPNEEDRPIMPPDLLMSRMDYGTRKAKLDDGDFTSMGHTEADPVIKKTKNTPPIVVACACLGTIDPESALGKNLDVTSVLKSSVDVLKKHNEKSSDYSWEEIHFNFSLQRFPKRETGRAQMRQKLELALRNLSGDFPPELRLIDMMVTVPGDTFHVVALRSNEGGWNLEVMHAFKELKELRRRVRSEFPEGHQSDGAQPIRNEEPFEASLASKEEEKVKVEDKGSYYSLQIKGEDVSERADIKWTKLLELLRPKIMEVAAASNKPIVLEVGCSLLRDLYTSTGRGDHIEKVLNREGKKFLDSLPEEIRNRIVYILARTQDGGSHQRIRSYVYSPTDQGNWETRLVPTLSVANILNHLIDSKLQSSQSPSEGEDIKPLGDKIYTSSEIITQGNLVTASGHLKKKSSDLKLSPTEVENAFIGAADQLAEALEENHDSYGELQLYCTIDEDSTFNSATENALVRHMRELSWDSIFEDDLHERAGFLVLTAQFIRSGRKVYFVYIPQTDERSLEVLKFKSLDEVNQWRNNFLSRMNLVE